MTTGTTRQQAVELCFNNNQQQQINIKQRDKYAQTTWRHLRPILWNHLALEPSLRALISHAEARLFWVKRGSFVLARFRWAARIGPAGLCGSTVLYARPPRPCHPFCAPGGSALVLAALIFGGSNGPQLRCRALLLPLSLEEANVCKYNADIFHPFPIMPQNAKTTEFRPLKPASCTQPRLQTHVNK